MQYISSDDKQLLDSKVLKLSNLHQVAEKSAASSWQALQSKVVWVCLLLDYVTA